MPLTVTVKHDCWMSSDRLQWYWEIKKNLTSVVNPPSAINNIQRGNTKKNPLARLQNPLTAAEPTRPILPTVLHINNSASYVNGNRTSRSRQLLFHVELYTVKLCTYKTLCKYKKKSIEWQYNTLYDRLMQRFRRHREYWPSSESETSKGTGKK